MQTLLAKHKTLGSPAIHSNRSLFYFSLAIFVVMTMLATMPATSFAQQVAAGFGNAKALGTLTGISKRPQLLVGRGTTTPRNLYHTFRFSVQRLHDVTIAANPRQKNVSVALFDSRGRFLVVGPQKNPRIRRNLKQGSYFVRIFGMPKRTSRYVVAVSGTVVGNPAVSPIPPRPTVVFNPPARPVTPPPCRVGRISYGGLLYANHSACSNMGPTAIPVSGRFTVRSSTMQFSGRGVRTIVALEEVNRRPGSFGVTRFGLNRFSANGRTLTVNGPGLALFKNRTFRVVVVTYVNRRPSSYTMPGTVTFR